MSPIFTFFNSLQLPLRQNCFTNSPPAAVPGSEFIAADLISPDLTGRAGWGSANGFDVQISSTFFPQSPTTPVPQVQVIYKRLNDQFEHELDAQGEPVFHVTNTAWQRVALAKPNTDVKEVRVRVFVPRNIQFEVPDSTNSIRIDRVCPTSAT